MTGRQRLIADGLSETKTLRELEEELCESLREEDVYWTEIIALAIHFKANAA